MRLPTTILAAIAAAALGSACAETGAYYTTGTTGVYATAVTPNLVTVGPGVSVIAGWNEPVFFSNNYYWRYYGNGWYRSPYYNRGWVYATPPYAISRIDRPWTYRNYRPYRYSGGYYRDQRYDGNRDYYRGDRYRYDDRYRQQQRYRDQQVYRAQQQRYGSYRDRDQRVYRDSGTYSGQRDRRQQQQQMKQRQRQQQPQRQPQQRQQPQRR